MCEEIPDRALDGGGLGVGGAAVVEEARLVPVVGEKVGWRPGEGESWEEAGDDERDAPRVVPVGGEELLREGFVVDFRHGEEGEGIVYRRSRLCRDWCWVWRG